MLDASAAPTPLLLLALVLALALALALNDELAAVVAAADATDDLAAERAGMNMRLASRRAWARRRA